LQGFGWLNVRWVEALQLTVVGKEQHIVSNQPARESVCQMMARLIESLKQEINTKQRRIQILNERLIKLQSQPKPDPVRVQETQAEIRELKDQLQTDRSQLDAAENEYAASCGAQALGAAGA
jgi:chromosome segregation ATPase